MQTAAASSIIVFAGPSLPAASRPADPRLRWAEPVLAGDLLPLAEDPPFAAVIIDGLFDRHPAVRHKEILELMARGTRVIGAASMGALRAAELDAFGMIGVGAVYAAYRDGRIWGDDEVALLHGPGELGWPTLSEPLVNVRATLIAARRARVIAAAEARALLQAARGLFYQERDWPAILAAAGAAAPAALRDWLATGRVDLKRRDAEACLRAALALPPGPHLAPPPPPRTAFTRALAALRPAR